MTIIHSFFSRKQGNRTVEIHVMDEVEGPQVIHELPGPTIKRTRPERPAPPTPRAEKPRPRTQEPQVEPEIEYKRIVSRGEGPSKTVRELRAMVIEIVICAVASFFIASDIGTMFAMTVCLFVAANVFLLVVRGLMRAVDRVTK